MFAPALWRVPEAHRRTGSARPGPLADPIPSARHGWIRYGGADRDPARARRVVAVAASHAQGSRVRDRDPDLGSWSAGQRGERFPRGVPAPIECFFFDAANASVFSPLTPAAKPAGRSRDLDAFCPLRATGLPSATGLAARNAGYDAVAAKPARRPEAQAAGRALLGLWDSPRGLGPLGGRPAFQELVGAAAAKEARESARCARGADSRLLPQRAPVSGAPAIAASALLLQCFPRTGPAVRNPAWDAISGTAGPPGPARGPLRPTAR